MSYFNMKANAIRLDQPNGGVVEFESTSEGIEITITDYIGDTVHFNLKDIEWLRDALKYIGYEAYKAPEPVSEVKEGDTSPKQ